MRASSRILFALFNLVLAVTFTPLVWSQTGTTSLRGTVTDKSGATITGAKVTVVNEGQSVRRDMTTGPNGVYEFLLLPPGNYDLTVEMTGFRTYEKKNIQLLVNAPGTADVVMEIGSTAMTVEVTGQTPTINTSDASLGIAFNQTQVRQLPLEGRNVPDLLTLQPGVVYTGNRTDIDPNVDTRSGAVNGARSDQSNISLDGVSVNPRGGYAFQSVLPVTLDSVQEFRVTTTGYNADQGTSSGAQVQLVTKSGTNGFHGSVYEYHRNTATSANDFFVKKAELESGQANQPLKLIRNIFGGSLGGPIVKDRLFFFLNYEGTRRAEQVSETQVVPTAGLRDGVVQYLCNESTPGVPDTSTCPGGTVTGLSGKTYNVQPGFNALGPNQIAGLDPIGAGVNPVMVQYLNTWPLPNISNVGDGVNFSGFNWRAPISDNQDVYIARLDFNLTRDGKQRLYVSGAMRNEDNPGAPFLPGQLPSHHFVNYNKGIIAGLSSVVTQNLLNNFRYGFIRQSIGDIGNTDQQVIFFRGLNDQLNAITYSHQFQRPVHNFYDDVSYTHGRHAWQFGFAISRLRNPDQNFTSSFSSGVTNASWLDTAGFAGSGNEFDPTSGGFPGVDPTFANSYDYPLIALLGMVTQVNAQYNYNRSLNLQPQGAPISRTFGQNSYEMYLQDTWKIKPTFTLTLGLRYSLFSPPWETHGLETVPTINMTDFFNTRGAHMREGIGSNADPVVSYQFGGPANHRSGYYNWDYKDFGPRVAFAWAPKFNNGFFGSLFGDGRTSIRGGFGIVYDRVGEGLVNTFDTSGGAFGLSAALQNTAGLETAATSPRLTSLNTIPTTDLAGNQIFSPAPDNPLTPPPTQEIQWGVDQGIKTPYSYAIDFSVARELKSGFSLEVAYVGRLSHRLLTQEDLAMPLNLRDKASGVDYFTAVQALAKLYRNGVSDANFSNSMVSPAVAQYWTNIIAPLQSGGAYGLGSSGGCGSGPASTTNPVLAAFDLFCGGSFNETTPLFILDGFGIPDASLVDASGNPVAYGPSTGFNSFFNPQFSSLYAWRSIASANYHALEATLRHQMSHGLQFDFNYTFSKSIDLSSDAERIGTWGGLGGQIINSWDPKALRAVSDFDTRHQFNANWIWELPFGRGRALAHDAHGALDAIIGGWQLSGLFRLTSGFPVNVSNGARWPTNWQLSGEGFLVSPVSQGRFTVPNNGINTDPGSPNIFGNAHDAVNNFAPPLPGQSGARNQIRGDGFFGVDMGLGKRWKMPWADGQSLQFRWEVFNITNSVRFNVASGSLFLDTQSTFGDYTGLLTNPRVMQFALRYEF